MAKEDLIGAWDLVSMEARHSDGTVTFPLGEEAVHDTVRAKIEQDGGPVRVAVAFGPLFPCPAYS